MLRHDRDFFRRSHAFPSGPWKQEAIMRNPPVAHSHLLSPPCSGRHSLAGRAFRIPNAAAAVTTTIVIRQERTLTLPLLLSSPRGAESVPSQHMAKTIFLCGGPVRQESSRVELLKKR